MPNRIIKESICESEGLSECSSFANDLYKRLIVYADDYGRFNADTAIMRARLFPRDYETITEEDIVAGLVELAGIEKISFYTPEVFNQKGKKGVYGAFPNWGEHQRVRDSKSKCPDPGDTDVNDWYLRRFISFDMRVNIIERDGFKCRGCGKFLTSCKDARRFAKLGQGLYHIDHIVPVVQGGRATEENLRLTCPECNLKRKKRFSFREILDFVENPQVAADCRELPQVAADCRLNPIQSESNTNPNPKVNAPARDPLERFDGELRNAVEDWLAYKRERKQGYKPTGLKTLLTEIENNAKMHGDAAVADVIRQSMSANYQGIVFDRLGRKVSPYKVQASCSNYGPVDMDNLRGIIDQM